MTENQGARTVERFAPMLRQAQHEGFYQCLTLSLSKGETVNADPPPFGAGK